MAAINFLRQKPLQRAGAEWQAQMRDLAVDLQPWSDLVTPVRPDVDNLSRVTLAEGFGPIRVSLDFAECDGNDVYLLEAVQGVMTPASELVWRPSERYVLRLATPLPEHKVGGGEFVMLDDQPAARGRMLHWSYEMCPFPIKLTIAQTSGKSKYMRYLVY